MHPNPLSAETVTALTQCLHAFFSHLDERRYGALVDTFVPQGRWLRQERWIEGHAAIRAALDARPADMRVRHVITNVQVLPGRDGQVRVEAYMTAYRQLGPQALPELFTISVITNEFVEQDGRWRLVEQQMLRDFEFPVAGPGR